MTCTVQTPIGMRTCELALTVKPTKNMISYTRAIAGEMRVAEAARVIRCWTRRRPHVR